MIVLVFILAIINPNGDFIVDAREVERCPDKAAFQETMAQKQANKEILGWTATCLQVDKRLMMSSTPS